MSNPDEVACRRIMAQANFSYKLITDSVIWAARDHDCPICKAAAYSPCMSMVKSKIDSPDRKQNKNPHTERVDWRRLFEALNERGVVLG